MKILIKIKYLGTAYAGYQIQKNRPTVQQKLNEAAKAVFGHECDITGCSRTDAGVHALCFCAVISDKGGKELVTSVPLKNVPRALNMNLPDDISVFYAAQVPDEFHPRYAVMEKTYKYFISDTCERDPFLAGRALHFPAGLSSDDIKRMNEAAQYLVGKNDFASFMASGSKISDTVRTITYAGVKREADHLTVFTVSADGFLYNMVRIMCGTLLDVGRGKILPEDIKSIIEARDRKKAGSTLPPFGLYLYDVRYDELNEHERS